MKLILTGAKKYALLSANGNRVKQKTSAPNQGHLCCRARFECDAATPGIGYPRQAPIPGFVETLPSQSVSQRHSQRGTILKSQTQASPPAPFGGMSTVNLPAAQNFQPAFFGIVTQLGLSVVAVIFKGVASNHPIFQHAELDEALGRDVREAKCGQFDSNFYHPCERWLIFHATNLAKCVSVLKAGLEKRGLITHAKIAVAETPDELVVWYPPTAERIL